MIRGKKTARGMCAVHLDDNKRGLVIGGEEQRVSWGFACGVPLEQIM